MNAFFKSKLMFLILFLNASFSSSSKQLISKKTYEYKLGHCEPLTIDFMATLVSKEARLLLNIDQRPKEKTISFDLYTRLNPNKRQVLRTEDYRALWKSNYNSQWPVRLIIHGWNGHTSTCSNAAIKDAYLAKGNFNVILVNWSEYSLDINYIRVVSETVEIGQQITDFTKFLHNATHVEYSNMYLIGHSLGVHVAATAGKLLKPDLYGVIYALDACGPLFNDPKNPYRLSPSDALYVESIQSDITLLGIKASDLGHASFYPNWGLGQRHCPNKTSMEVDFMCDHFGSLYYFAESIKNSKAFGAIKCTDFKSIEKLNCRCRHGQPSCSAQTYMGGEPAVPKHGIYYLSTRRSRPFGYGDKTQIKKAKPSTITKLRANRV